MKIFKKWFIYIHTTQKKTIMITNDEIFTQFLNDTRDDKMFTHFRSEYHLKNYEITKLQTPTNEFLTLRETNFSHGPSSLNNVITFLRNVEKYKENEEIFSKSYFQMTQSYAPKIMKIICIENLDETNKYKYFIIFVAKKADYNGQISDKLFFIIQKIARSDKGYRRSKIVHDEFKNRHLVKKITFFRKQTDKSMKNLFAMIYIKMFLNIYVNILDIRYNKENITHHCCFRFESAQTNEKLFYKKLPPIFSDLKSSLDDETNMLIK